MRLQIQDGQLPDGRGGVTILNDAYNANPASVQAAMETLVALPAGTPNAPARRVAIVGDMRELGEQSDFYHLELGRKLARLERDIELFVLVGQQSKLIEQELLRGRLPAARIVHFDDSAAAAKLVPGLLEAGDLVLLKASRGIALEKIAAALLPVGAGRKVG
jgi:UDP-N-acetylmuramoyl-tripeptide--D-alanyl-D-alanine ligase